MPGKASVSRIGQRLRFRDLQVFIAVVQNGSMGKAAAQLGVTQPAVSELIAGLEGTIGVRLLDRSPQGVEPTIYGLALMKRGIAAFDELKQGLRDIEFLADPTVGEVRIGCPDSVVAAILPRMIATFSSTFPGIALQFDQVPTPTLELPALHARKLDAVIAWLSLPRDELGDGLDVEVLLDDQVVIAADRSSSWARRRRIDIAELVDAAWTGTPPETLNTMILEQAFRARNLPPPRLQVTTYSVVLRHHLLTTGQFLTALPRSLLGHYAGLKALPVMLPDHAYPVAIVTVRNRTLNPAVELFLDHLRRFIRSGGAGGDGTRSDGR